ncbi:class I SAM-dependent methyltransferase [Candidatus Entotheonella palauensis]|uniref:class I SAM-dependent methyltransferase n=1 Tax=Candidatus Entotheonella palauensis TaxID=93172 RepID=UPI0015C4A7C5
MQSDDLKREWHNLSPAWIKEAREGRNPSRNGLLDKPVIETCGNVTGLRILDCGCGEGRFCRILVGRGARYVLGLDLCEPMIEAARAWQSERDAYRVADVQDLHFLEGETFDLTVSYLNQCDLPDFEANNREVFRVLKSGRRFIVPNLHPMRSAVGAWHRNHDGEKQHVIVDHYFDESERRWKMMGALTCTRFIKTFSTRSRAQYQSLSSRPATLLWHRRQATHRHQ